MADNEQKPTGLPVTSPGGSAPTTPPKKPYARPKNKKFPFVILIIVLGLGAFYAYNTFLKKADVSPGADPDMLNEEMMREEKISVIPVRVFKVAKSDFVDTFPSMGTIKGIREVNLRFESSGIIEAMNFKEGDLVKRSDVIAALSMRDAQLNIEYNESKLKTVQAEQKAAKKKMEVYQKLYEAGSIIKAKLDEVRQEYDVLKTKVKTAKLEVEHSENELDKRTLFAPIDGILSSKESEVGELANPNTKIATLTDISSVYVEIGITERDIEKIKLGQKVKVSVDTYPDVDFFGKIDNIFPQVEGKSRTMTVKIKLENSDMMLKPGMFARVAINIYEKKDALLVSSGALRKQDEAYFVFVVNKEEDKQEESNQEETKQDIVLKKVVEPGYRTIEYVILEKGVSEGDLVVTEYQGDLKDKSPCEVLEVQEYNVPQS